MEREEDRMDRTVAFLSMLKYPGIPDQQEAQDEFMQGPLEQNRESMHFEINTAFCRRFMCVIGLRVGDRNIVYPIMHWLLSKFAHLSKRAYLAKYLSRIDVPAEYMSDDHLVSLMQQLQALQKEFTQTHKAVDQLRSSQLRPVRPPLHVMNPG